MLYKGIIIEIKEGYSIVVTNESEFFRIKNKEGMKVGNKIYFLEEDIYSIDEKKVLSSEDESNVEKDNTINIKDNDIESKDNIIDFKEKSKKNKFNIYKRLLSVAAAIAIIVGTVVYTAAPKSYATVSFDENGSSIELSLDKNKNINSTSLINGNLNISDDDDFSKILDQLYNQIKKDSKNNKTGRVLVGLCFEDAEDIAYEKEIKALISKKFKGLNVMYVRVDKNQVEQNQNAEISMGEYAAMKMIEEDDIEGMTMEKLNKMLKDGKYAYLREEILDELEDRSEGYEYEDDDDIDDIEDYYKKEKNNKSNNSKEKTNKKFTKYEDSDVDYDDEEEDYDDDNYEEEDDDSDDED